MPSIDLYNTGTDRYDELQAKRPDYVSARKVFIDLASHFLTGKTGISVADFCCGTGNNTELIAGRFEVAKATLIDINKEFLGLAKQSTLKGMVGELVTIQSDILNASVPSENDIVISMFAYHHVPNQSKQKYIEVAKSALKRGGILVLGEIYSPNKETTLKYYADLWNAIDPRVQTPALQTFLRQTAESEDFEYKVSKQFAHDQLVEAGFELLISQKIWPDTLDDVGTYVEVWKRE